MQRLIYNWNYQVLPSSVGPPAKDPGCYFKDGERKIDFILCYSLRSSEDERLSFWREKYILELKTAKIEIEAGRKPEDGEEEDFIQFYKCHCPVDVLMEYAESLSLHVPLKKPEITLSPSTQSQDKGVISNWSEILLKKLKLSNPFSQDVPSPPTNSFTAVFRRSKLDQYMGGEDPSTLFTDTQRARIMFEILETTRFGKPQSGEMGIRRLVEVNSFEEAYPLHEALDIIPSYYRDEVDGTERLTGLNKRQVLREYWAKWKRWYKYQPLDHIREYFGEKIAFYFAWLGHYTSWLIIPSVVGLIIFIYSLATMTSEKNRDALDICDAKPWQYRMCPLCEEDLHCSYWDLRHSCGIAKVSYLFDNEGTVFFAVFLSFWAVFFQEFWKRRESFLAHHWDCYGYESEAERPRPAFTATADEKRTNPVTEEEEPYFSPSRRTPRIFSGILIILVMLTLVLIFMVGVIVYKLLIFRPLAQHHETRHYAFQVASATGAVLNLFCILILSSVYEKLAVALTDWEMHRTQTEYDDNLTFKVFVFQFVNFYSSIFYIAFFKGKLVGSPGHYTTMLKLRQEECAPGGCLMELAQQLFIIMVGKQVIGNVQEMLVPVLKIYWNKKMKGSDNGLIELPRWEEDFYHLDKDEGLFSEYLEMVIQFGFITIFVAAFPLAPLFALANNIFEIRIDSIKFVTEKRRPVAERAQDIGIWFNILQAVAQIAVISNAFLIAFTSNFLPKLLYKYNISPDQSLSGYLNFSLAWAPVNTTRQPCRYRDFRDANGDFTRFYWHLLALRLGFVIAFEHFVFATNRVIDLLVPDIPEDLSIAIQREAHIAKKALADNPIPSGGGSIGGSSFRNSPRII